MGNKQNSYIGFEIGNSQIKIEKTKKGKIINFATEDIPDDMIRAGEIIQWEAMGDFIKSCTRKHRIAGKKAAIAVPDSVAFIRRTKMPPMNVSQLEYNLPYEFNDFITDDKDKYVYDYSMIGLIEDEEGNVSEMEMLACAAPKEIMARYMVMFKRAGLKLVLAAPECWSVGNIFSHLIPNVREGDYAVLDLGSMSTRINIFSHGVYEVTRRIDMGCRTISTIMAEQYGCDIHIAELMMRDNKDNFLESEVCQNIYGRIAIDVMRAINYYTFENRDNNLEKLYYCGGGSVIDPLIREISETIQLELVPFSSITDKPKEMEAIMGGAAATGICWGE